MEAMLTQMGSTCYEYATGPDLIGLGESRLLRRTVSLVWLDWCAGFPAPSL